MYQGKQVSVTDRESGIALLKVSNPPDGYMDDATEKELVEALDLIHERADITVVVISGGLPGVFIRHYDTLVLEARARQMAARGLRFDPAHPVPEVSIHRVLREIEQSSCTYIAAINGTAMGAGYELALACDLRLAQAGRYRIGLPEVNLGLVPGVGGTQRLTRLIGQARALELMLMGDTLSPHEARSYGLVNDVVDGEVLSVALQLAAALAARPARARAHNKQLVSSAVNGDIGAGYASERTLFCNLMVNPDTHERLKSLNNGQVDVHGQQLPDAE